MPAVITALARREAGGAVVTMRTGIHFLDFTRGELQVLSPLPDPPPFAFNDGKVDRRGRFVIGASGAGYVYRIDGLGARGVPEPRYAG